MEKYKNKYRIQSTWLQNWDYGWAGAYFITICTHNRKHFFGVIGKNAMPCVFHKMQLSEIGKIVETEWLKTFEMRPDMNLTMGEFIIMPNHFHAIIFIGENQYNTKRTDAMHCPSTKFEPQSKNLASIIRGYKIGVTKNARKINPDFAWQTRFYDHIIRNEKSFIKISGYIVNNPIKWENDKFYKRENV